MFNWLPRYFFFQLRRGSEVWSFHCKTYRVKTASEKVSEINSRGNRVSLIEIELKVEVKRVFLCFAWETLNRSDWISYLSCGSFVMVFEISQKDFLVSWYFVHCSQAIYNWDVQNFRCPTMNGSFKMLVTKQKKFKAWTFCCSVLFERWEKDGVGTWMMSLIKLRLKNPNFHMFLNWSSKIINDSGSSLFPMFYD